MRKYIFILSILTGAMVLTCNRVPVRELKTHFKVQVQELRSQGKPVKVDILWVVDDSPSMCQEQASLAHSFSSFMQVLKQAGRIDPHIAVTTTNMCKKGSPGAIRGKFVYQPAKSFPPACIQSMVQPCYKDSDCDPGWTCRGTVGPRDMYICDNPVAPGAQKPFKLVTVNPRSYCMKHCDRESQPLLCADNFGQSRSCKDLCKKGSCKVQDCVAQGMGSDAECAKVCSITNTCEAKCDMFFKDPEKCKKVCASNTPCQSKCKLFFNDQKKCDAFCAVPDSCESKCKAAFGDKKGCEQVCMSINSCEASCETLFKDKTKCSQVCAPLNTCQDKCEAFLGDKAKCQQVCSDATSCSDTCRDLFKHTRGATEKCADVCTDSCSAQCDMVLGDHDYCGQVCNTDCFTGCAGQYNQRRSWYKGIFDRDDVACGVICKPDPSCDELCEAQFGGRNVKCVYPGGDKNGSGCMKYPETSICPKHLGAKYNILDNALTDKWFKAWKQGKWVGDPAWKDLPEDEVREKVFEQLFKCMATVGATQQPCANQEMGLRAAWQALNPKGENADQAKAFLRDDAYLLVVIVSDEDDCSTDKLLSGNDAVRCACLKDQDGCPDEPGVECDPRHPGPLIPVTRLVSELKSLKKPPTADPSMVLFAAITGEPIPKSYTTPLTDEKATLDEYYKCKCAYGRNASANYICKSTQGISDYGSRYILASQCFGKNYGVVSNICNNAGLEDALREIVQRFSPLFARICLPRPLGPDEMPQIYRLGPNGQRIKATYDAHCDHQDKDHFYLVKNSPGCPKVDIQSGYRLENAIAFCKPLAPDDNVEIVYQAAPMNISTPFQADQ